MNDGFVRAADGTRIYWQVDGQPDGMPVLFSNSLCCSIRMWDFQVRFLGKGYKLVRYDLRGHGRSEQGPGECTIEVLAQDAVAVLDALGIERTNFVGLSVGGMIGMHLGAYSAERIRRIILANTSAHLPPAQKWTDRIVQARKNGMGEIAAATLARWFTPEFPVRSPETYASFLEEIRNMAAEGYAGICAALRDADLRSALGRIAPETLVIAGAEDVAPLSHAEALAGSIPSARLVIIEKAGHLANLEQPAVFSQNVRAFLTKPT